MADPRDRTRSILQGVPSAEGVLMSGMEGYVTSAKTNVNIMSRQK